MTGKPSYSVSIMEFRGAKVARETQYFADPFVAPASRAQWVERMDAQFQGANSLPICGSQPSGRKILPQIGADVRRLNRKKSGDSGNRGHRAIGKPEKPVDIEANKW